MRNGQRVALRESGQEGIILKVIYPLTPAMTEAEVQWDNGLSGWEMGEDLKVLPNLQGDAFIAMRNGFGVRRDETFPSDPVIKLRENAATEAELFLRERFGLIKVRHPVEVDRDRQLTLDIRRM